MFHSRKKSAGMVLTEVLIALATLTTGVIALGTITTSSISTTILSRDYLVAEGLVTEAVEIVKNIRDTNWLKYPNKKDSCWLVIGGACNFPTLPSANSNYLPIFANGSWILSNMGNKDLNLDVSPPGFYQLFIDASQQYVYGGVVKSKFSRSVKFTIVNKDSATFEVKVQWKDGAKTREIKKTVILHNYI